MPKKPETKFRERFVKRLKAIPKSYWESIQQKSINGSLDLHGCVNGHCVVIELKASEKSPVTKLQEYKLSKWREAGALALLVYPENETVNLKRIEAYAESDMAFY